jgi:hypothetical protein
MSELPDNIKALQEKFRPRIDAQDARIVSAAAASLASEVAAAEVTHDLPMEEGLALLAAEAGKNS